MDKSAVEQVLKDASEVVKGAAVAKELQAVAFEKAVELLAGQATPAVDPASGKPPDPGSTTPKSGAGEDRSLEKVAGRLGLSPETVGEVYHVDGEALSLGIGTTQLESTKAKGAKQIALLVATGRQAGGWDAEWTPTSEIRSVAEAYGKFDSGNFAKALREMNDAFSFSGTRQNLKVRLKRKGYENATALVKQLAGEE